MSKYASKLKGWSKSSFNKVPFSKTSGDEFIQLALKTLGKRRLNINFQKRNIENAIDELDMNDELPLLLYVHNPEHALSKKILLTILQDSEIAPLIVTLLVI